MEHAIRHHIKKKLDEDPVHYQKLSERLEEILKKFGENWEQLALALKDFVEEARPRADRGRTRASTGTRPADPRPVLRPPASRSASKRPVQAADLRSMARRV
jgi:type I restriction enzyme R subunit